VIDVDIKGFFDNINHGKLLKQIWALGIRDKQLICILSKILKAEIKGIDKPNKGTPQGGIISPLLANICLNEFDWWIASQWENLSTKHHYTDRYEALRKAKLKEMFIVRYADDFKIFCRDPKTAKRAFIAIKQWLWERLRLEINEDKSGITNIRRKYTDFLGIKLKVRPKGKTTRGGVKYVAKSHISDKAKERICQTVQKHVKNLQKPINNNFHKAINAFNSYLLGLHNYYNAATECVKDFSLIAFLSRSSIKNRLKPRRRRKEDTIPKYIKDRYGGSKQLRFYHDRAILPIGYVQCEILLNCKQLSPYNSTDRELVHTNQKVVHIQSLQYLIEKSDSRQSVEYNDNRISLYVGQYGKCYVLGVEILPQCVHCHHLIPKSKGGTDKYKNLVIIHEELHILVHATDKGTIQHYLGKWKLSADQLGRLNYLRQIAELPTI
jgi:5-methylcytosine-specific restriction endonuclease McrA